MALVCPPDILRKIGRDDHGNVTEKEVIECFDNHTGGYCYDSRSQHLDGEGRPSTWFVANTNHGRTLKIMFVREHGNVYLKSAYPATDKVRAIFNKYNI